MIEIQGIDTLVSMDSDGSLVTEAMAALDQVWNRVVYDYIFITL
jgi:hypothetical protein